MEFPVVDYAVLNKDGTRKPTIYTDYVSQIVPEELSPGTKMQMRWGKAKKPYNVEILAYYNNKEEAQGKFNS